MGTIKKHQRYSYGTLNAVNILQKRKTLHNSGNVHREAPKTQLYLLPQQGKHVQKKCQFAKQKALRMASRVVDKASALSKPLSSSSSTTTRTVRLLGIFNKIHQPEVIYIYVYIYNYTYIYIYIYIIYTCLPHTFFWGGSENDHDNSARVPHAAI